MRAAGADSAPRPLLGRRGVFLAALCSLIGLGLLAELRTYARPDTGFLLDAAARVLDGSRLYVDVVEINPPLIVALNIPAVLVGRLLGISDILVYRARLHPGAARRAGARRPAGTPRPAG